MNEVSLFLARRAYSKVVLNKEFDWNMIKRNIHVTQPKSSFIPRGVLPFLEGGLGPI